MIHPRRRSNPCDTSGRLRHVGALAVVFRAGSILGSGNSRSPFRGRSRTGCVNSANVRLWRRQRRQADGFFCRPVIVHGHGDMSFRSYAYVIVRFDERAHARSSVTLSVKTTLGNRPALDASSGMPHADVVFRHVGVRRMGRRLTLIGDGMRACRCGEGVCLSGRRSMVCILVVGVVVLTVFVHWFRLLVLFSDG